MESTSLNARLVQLHDTEVNWDRVPDFVPMTSEMVIFEPDDAHPYNRVKFGDGTTCLKDLPFNTEMEINTIFNLQNGIFYMDGGKITDYISEVSK